MSTLAKVAYLTALLFQSQQRLACYRGHAAAGATTPDQVAAQRQLAREQAHQQDLFTERASYLA